MVFKEVVIGYLKRLRGVISKIRAKLGMVIIGDTADPNSALCIHMIHYQFKQPNDYLSHFSHQFNLLKVKSSIDAESEDQYNKNLLECIMTWPQF